MTDPYHRPMQEPIKMPLRKRVHTKERLRLAAAPIFATKGIAAVPIDALCDAAGFSRGAFYSNYISKYDLALEILAERQTDELCVWRDMLLGATDLDSTILTLTKRFDIVATQTNWGLLNVELQIEAEREGAFGYRYREYIEILYKHVSEMVEAFAIKSGVTIPDNTREIAMAVRCFAMGLMLHSGRQSPMPTMNSPGKMMIFFLKGAVIG